MEVEKNNNGTKEENNDNPEQVKRAVCCDMHALVTAKMLRVWIRFRNNVALQVKARADLDIRTGGMANCIELQTCERQVVEVLHLGLPEVVVQWRRDTEGPVY